MLDREKVKEVLLRAGMEKVFIEEVNYECVLALGTCEGRELLIMVIQGVHAVYAKVLPAENLPSPYWRCNYVEYTPIGLYTFASSLDELSEKLKPKIKAMVKARLGGVGL